MTPVETLVEARRLHASGELHRAAEMYHQVLEDNPRSADVWRSLSEIRREQGRFSEAASGFQRALRLRPGDPEILNGLGITEAQLGRVADAVDTFRRAVASAPDYAQAIYNLGIALVEARQFDDAITNFHRAIELNPDYLEARISLGNTLIETGAHRLAVDAFWEAIRLRPDSAEALNGLGLALIGSNRAAAAVVMLRQAARLKPGFSGAYNNLGLALAEEGRYSEAEAAYEKALSTDPRYAEAHANLGNLFKEQQQLPEALACYDIALALKQDCISARWNRALALLQSGDYTQGWVEYESRWFRKKGSVVREFPQPIWDGTSLKGQRILVHTEQGLGDTLQFARYVSLLKAAEAHVIFETPSPLTGVLQSLGGVDEMIVEGQSIPDFDVHIPLMSLPRLFHTTVETIPGQTPYLFTDADRALGWRERLAGLEGLKVGIAWQGNPHHQWDRHRSIALAALRPLADIDGVHLLSLQRGPGSEQVRCLDDGFKVQQLLDPSLPDSDALVETAAMMVNLDLVISVDTATAHLAGALGVRSWVLLSMMLDWRWLLSRSDTPWYPHMRLFRQSRRGEWQPVVSQLTTELKTLAGQPIELAVQS